MSIFNLIEYDYKLPVELIANRPADRRDSSRLMVVDRFGGEVCHQFFCDILSSLDSGYVMVLNNSRVFNARLVVLKKGKGLMTEMLFLRHMEPDCWEVLCKRAKKVRVGDVFVFFDGDEEIEMRVVDRLDDGHRVMELGIEKSRFLDILQRNGTVPLPPYISTQPGVDYESRYQTVYAEKTGSVAAPTAGLHFTQDLLDEIKKKGISVETVTLHIGPGTFQPVREMDLRKHMMHGEEMEVDKTVAARLNQYKKAGKKILAVGTTAARWLESLADGNGFLREGDRQLVTDLFIYPGYKFKFIDALLTNFHLPKSTLLMLVAAFLGEDERGIKKLMNLYDLAIEKKYRFYSFGDAMLIK